MKFSLAFVTLIGSAVLCQAPAASAEQAKAPSSAIEALIEDCIALRRAKRDEDALRCFHEADRLSPLSARVQALLAGTYQALGDWLRADEYMRRALEQTEDAFVVRHRATLELAQQAIRDHLGELAVEGTPPGAAVRLDGRLEGTLPLRAPIRTLAGSHTLEVSRGGYYPVRRPVTLLGGQLTRESVRLAPEGDGQARASEVEQERPPPVLHEQERGTIWTSEWLTWTLGGLGAVAAGASFWSWGVREAHAERWNDDARCLRPGQSREQVCGDEHAASERAEAVMAVGAVASGVFGAGAVLTVLLREDADASERQLGFACVLQVAGARCAARF